jgi:CheY-like chemotaxis protein
MGGSITVASTLGVGSTFSVEIPFGRSNGKPRPTVTNASRTRTRPPRAAGGRVLVAEDNAINQLVARQMIRKLGYECDVVANGSEAVEALKERAYAVVLMDCYMPEMDGFVATQRIRDDEGCSKHTPVIAMTALAMAEDRQRCREAGMDDYVSKPVSFDALRSALEQWITVDTA